MYTFISVICTFIMVTMVIILSKIAGFSSLEIGFFILITVICDIGLSMSQFLLGCKSKESN